MGGNVLYTPALQAPIALSNPTGRLQVIGTGTDSNGQIIVGSDQGALALAGMSPQMALQMAASAGASSVVGYAPVSTPRILTKISSAVGALLSAGQTPTIAIAGPPARNAIKWHPGWGMGSNTTLGFNASNLQGILDEITILKASVAAAVHYRFNFMWGAWEIGTQGSQNQFNTALLGQIYTAITGISKPSDYPSKWTGRRMSFLFSATRIGGSGKDCVPPDIYNNPATYGSPPSGALGGGYWFNTALSNPNYFACLHRPPIMNRYIAAFNAFATAPMPSGFTLDNDPLVEILFFPETTAFTVTPSAPDYSFTNLDAQMKIMLPQVRAAFLHTNLAAQNNYWNTIPATMSLCESMRSSMWGISSPDLFGLTAVKNLGGFGTGPGIDGTITWGYRWFMGTTAANAHVAGEYAPMYNPIPNGIAPKLGQMFIAVDVQDPEVTGHQFTSYGSPFAVNDIGDNADQTLNASHVFFVYESGSGPTVLDAHYRNVSTYPGNWTTQVQNYISSTPIKWTAAPTDYPAVILT